MSLLSDRYSEHGRRERKKQVFELSCSQIMYRIFKLLPLSMYSLIFRPFELPGYNSIQDVHLITI